MHELPVTMSILPIVLKHAKEMQARLSKSHLAIEAQVDVT
jgi:Zn finger protein HypA/HybF involved in hydrogenase expression